MMTPKERAVMQQALEALNKLKRNLHGRDLWEKHSDAKKAITALREALDHFRDATKKVAEQAEHERMSITKPVVPWYDREDSTNVLAEQAEQEPVAWIDLTGVEIGEVWAKHPRDFDKCVAIIEKFKEKNTNPVTAKEKPVAWMCSDPKLLGSGYSRFSECCAGVWNIPVYAAPVSIQNESETDSSSSSMRTTVRTKDLTDVDLWKLWEKSDSNIAFARAVIATYKEKNK